MKNLIKNIFQLWPKRWIATALVLLCILYLTLVPRPLPNNNIDMPGLDKLVHAMMFGALAFVSVIDVANIRRHQFKILNRNQLLAIATGVSIFGGLIELLQLTMNAGRSGDVVDFVADIVGAIVGTWLAFKLLDGFNKQKRDL